MAYPDATETHDVMRQIFEKQKQLYDRYISIELGNGFYTPPREPAPDINDRFFQSWFRRQAFFFVEEIGEAIETLDQTQDMNDIRGPLMSELADATHFLVQLSFMAGVQAEHAAMIILGVRSYVKDEFRTIESMALTVITDMVRATHLLKNKPWKCTPVATDQQQLWAAVTMVWSSWTRFCNSLQAPTKKLGEAYFAKHQENLTRQETRY